jgi:hypothetical protein
MKAIEQLEYAPNTLARNFRTTDRKSLLAFRGVGPESAAESVRFHWRRVTKVGPEVKHGARGAGGLQNPDTWINLALSVRLAESYPASGGKDDEGPKQFG